MKTLLLKILLLGFAVMNLCLVLQLHSIRYELNQVQTANSDWWNTSDWMASNHFAVTSNLNQRIEFLQRTNK